MSNFADTSRTIYSIDMSKRRLIFLLSLCVLVAAVIFTTVNIRKNKSQELTFAACTERGGTAWQVDLYHPQICSSCAEFRECEIEYNDLSEECPECYGACQACQDQYSVYESCPECYGACQACQNKYLNQFESEAQRYELCPECETCNTCREEIEIKRSSCPACLSCNECRDENKSYTDIGDVCPQIVACTDCMNSNFPYPDRCPDGKESIGEITDAATWFLCCK